MASITIRRVVVTNGGGASNGTGNSKKAVKKAVNIRVSDRLASRG